MVSIINNNYEELRTYYNTILNLDKNTYKTSNDEPTPINCIDEMLSKIPIELWSRENLTILDPCCGNGNFCVPIYDKLTVKYDTKRILEHIFYFNDVNTERIDNVNKVFCGDMYKLNISSVDFIKEYKTDKQFDLIMANPPYAKLLENGKRTAKNHNLIKEFIEKSLGILKPNGYLLFITPDNWMSYSDRNTLIEKLTGLQIIHLNIHTAKKYFKKIGSSFTWYIIQNCSYYQDISVSGIWKNKEYSSFVLSQTRRYIPLFYNKLIQSILNKTIDNTLLTKFQIKTSSYLHKYTKKDFISVNKDDTYKNKLIHTPRQTVYSSIPHKYQDGFKVFISLTDKYSVFIDDCGMTQSIAFILCSDKLEADKYKFILEHPLYVFINNICRWGNFNNVRILQNFPIPLVEDSPTLDVNVIYDYFHITNEEIEFIKNN